MYSSPNDVIASANKLSTAQKLFCQPNYARWFYGILIFHVLFWTLVPTLLRHSLPMDALEGFVWGQSWQLGYDRNPWLNAWLTHLAVIFGGRSGLLVYFLSQLSIGACFFAIWRLGKKILTPAYALLAALLLEGVQYYNLAAVDFNDNVLEIGLWALLTLYFYEALTQQKLRAWLLTGLWAALALMAKYYTLVLFVPMSLLLVFTPEGRKNLKQKEFYFGLILFAAITAPHFVWLFKHGFVTFNYMLERTSEGGDWQNSWWYFGFMQILAFSIPLILLAWLWLLGQYKKNIKSTILVSNKDAAVTHFAKIFLLAMGLLPFILTILVAAFSGITMHARWGTPLVSLWGLLLLALRPPVITCRRFYIFIIFTLLMLVGLLALYAYSLVYIGYQSSATYPAKEIAAYIDNEWHHHYPSSLPHYVVGDRYTAGNVAYFSKNKLRVCVWDTANNDRDHNRGFCQSASTESVSAEMLREKGAIFVWQPDDNFFTVLKIVGKIKQYFPESFFLGTRAFSWVYHPDKPKLAITTALLAPKTSRK